MKPVINQRLTIARGHEVHVKRCQCKACNARRFDAYQQRVQLMSVPLLPTEEDQLVPVRSYFRRAKKFQPKNEEFRTMVQDFIRGMLLSPDTLKRTEQAVRAVRKAVKAKRTSRRKAGR